MDPRVREDDGVVGYFPFRHPRACGDLFGGAASLIYKANVLRADSGNDEVDGVMNWSGK